MRQWKRFVPLLVSAGIIAWLLSVIDTSRFLQSLTDLRWGLVLLVTCLFVIGLYFWDGVCLWVFFADPKQPLSYQAALRARGCAYLFMIIQFGLGQGLLAWLMSKAQNKSIISAAGRCVLMTYMDVCVLLSLGLIGATLSSDPRTDGIALFCLVALVGMLSLTIIPWLLPSRMVERIKGTRLGKELEAADFSLRQLVTLYPLRMVYFIIGLFHIGIILWVGGIELNWTQVMSVIPITALVDGLPISVSGLGTREAMLIAFLQPDREKLMACTMVWWVFVVLSRGAIGMGNLWIPRMVAWVPSRQT